MSARICNGEANDRRVVAHTLCPLQRARRNPVYAYNKRQRGQLTCQGFVTPAQDSNQSICLRLQARSTCGGAPGASVSGTAKLYSVSGIAVNSSLALSQPACGVGSSSRKVRARGLRTREARS